jgi:hypothetical protein
MENLYFMTFLLICVGFIVTTVLKDRKDYFEYYNKK